MSWVREMWKQFTVVCARWRTEIKGKHARENLAHVVTAVEQHLPLVLERAVARSREGQFAARLESREWGGGRRTEKRDMGGSSLRNGRIFSFSCGFIPAAPPSEAAWLRPKKNSHSPLVERSAREHGDVVQQWRMVSEKTCAAAAAAGGTGGGRQKNIF